MAMLVWIGTVVTLAGLAGLALSILKVRVARRDATDDADLRQRLQGIIPLNLAAFLISALGLMLVVVGVLLV